MNWNDTLDVLGASRYMAQSNALTGDPIAIFMYTMAYMSSGAAFLTIGLSLLLFRGLPSPMRTRPRMRYLFAAMFIMAFAAQITGMLTIFSGVYRLDIIVRAALAAVATVTAILVLHDFLELRHHP